VNQAIAWDSFALYQELTMHNCRVFATPVLMQRVSDGSGDIIMSFEFPEGIIQYKQLLQSVSLRDCLLKSYPTILPAWCTMLGHAARLLKYHPHIYVGTISMDDVYVREV
jgi:hypothetical protein